MLIFLLLFEDIFTLIENKVSFFQSQIFLFTSSFQFTFVNLFQRLFMSSIFSRLSVVHEIFFPEFHFLLSETRRLQLVFSIRKKLLSTSFSSVYFSKCNGGSSFFKIPNLYFLLYSRLFLLSFNPYSEKFLNRFSFYFRPFRSSHEAFSFLKINIMLRIKYSVFYCFLIRKSLGSTSLTSY